MKSYSVSKAAVQGVAAGVDLFLVCHTEAVQLQVVDAIAAALLSGELSQQQVAAAAGRIDECCARFCAAAPAGDAPPPDPRGLVGTAEHKRRVAEALQSRL